jgi:hypothetical protein
MSILGAFNNVLSNFMEDCILVFPEENEFKIYKKGLDFIIKYNPKKVLTIFDEYSQLYRQKIMDKNEDFFMENKYDVVSKYNDPEIFNIINKIKMYWKVLDSNNKEKIWDYLILLIRLRDKYYA